MQFDIESYLEYMTDSRLIEMASLKYSSVTLLTKKETQVSGRKGLVSIFHGIRGGALFLVLTLSTVRQNSVYELQCVTTPEMFDEVFLTFLFMGESLKITPD